MFCKLIVTFVQQNCQTQKCLLNAGALQSEAWEWRRHNYNYKYCAYTSLFNQYISGVSLLGCLQWRCQSTRSQYWVTQCAETLREASSAHHYCLGADSDFPQTPTISAFHSLGHSCGWWSAPHCPFGSCQSPCRCPGWDSSGHCGRSTAPSCGSCNPEGGNWRPGWAFQVHEDLPQSRKIKKGEMVSGGGSCTWTPAR